MIMLLFRDLYHLYDRKVANVNTLLESSQIAEFVSQTNRNATRSMEQRRTEENANVCTLFLRAINFMVDFLLYTSRVLARSKRNVI